MNEIINYVTSVAKIFKHQLGTSLVDVYKMGSLAHGGFSQIYSDIDIGMVLSSPAEPEGMNQLICEVKALVAELGKRLSVFWGNPAHDWGRLRVLDRLDLLDHGVPLLGNHKANFKRPDKGDIHHALLEFLEKNWQPRTQQLAQLSELPPSDHKPFIKCLLYPARLIYTWDRLEIASNDQAVEYLQEIKPFGLDLHPIKLALACRHNQCTPDRIFSQKISLDDQFKHTISYISKRRFFLAHL